MTIPRSVIFICFWVSRYATGDPLCAALWDAAPAGRTATCRGSPWLTESLLAARWDFKTETHTARISPGRLHISFHDTTHFRSTTYFHWCVLSRESLIDCSFKGEYATLSQPLHASSHINNYTPIVSFLKIKYQFFSKRTLPRLYYYK